MRPDLPQIMAAEYERDARFYEAQKHRLLKEAQKRSDRRIFRQRLFRVAGGIVEGVKGVVRVALSREAHRRIKESSAPRISSPNAQVE